MTDVVLDASALLALLLDEPGGDKVKAMLDGALLGAVNLAEIVSHYAKLGAARSDIEALLQPLPVRVVPIDARLSYEAGYAPAGDAQGGAVARRSLLPGTGEAGRHPGCDGGASLARHRSRRGRYGGADPLALKAEEPSVCPICDAAVAQSANLRKHRFLYAFAHLRAIIGYRA